MDEELFNKWLKALRSGEYEKGTGWLKTKNKYCCVGVLSEIAGLEKEWTAAVQAFSFEGEHVQAHPTLQSKFPQINWLDLYSLNDTNEKTFEEIADYLEETYKT